MGGWVRPVIVHLHLYMGNMVISIVISHLLNYKTYLSFYVEFCQKRFLLQYHVCDCR